MPLHVAADAGRAGVVGVLLDVGVQPDAVTRHTTPLHARQTALHLAAAGGHRVVVRLLVERGATVEVRDALGRSPLWLAARHLHGELCRSLLEHDADANATDRQGRSTLHAALLAPPATPDGATPDPAGRVAVVDVLLRGGADPNATCPRDADGYTPLHRVALLGPAAAPLRGRLLEAGADPTVADPRHGRVAPDPA